MNTIIKSLHQSVFCLFLIIGMLKVNATTALNNDIEISIELEDVTLKEALDKIESMTNLTFFYKTEDLNLSKKKTIKAKKARLNDILLELLEEESLNFKILDNHIILKKEITPKKVIQQKYNFEKKYKIEGRIIDKSTGEFIPYCSVVIKGVYIGTSSNEEGEFIIDVDELPVDLVFSHLGYEEQTVSVTKVSNLEIKLNPFTYNLEEVLISTKSDKRALNLARQAYNKMINTLSDKKYGKALYRQKSKNGEDYTELSEIIYDINYSNQGIDKWDIIEGRYALNASRLNNKNYTLFSRLLKSIYPQKLKNLVFPMSPEFEVFYNVNIINTINTDKDKIEVLWFKPKYKTNMPIFEGEVYVNSKTHEILKVKGSIYEDKMNLISFSETGTNKKNYELTYEINFKKDLNLDIIIDYINVNQDFDYYKGEEFQTHISTNSTLSFFEYYTPTSRKKLGKQFRRRDSDWEKLNEIGYNKEFWAENPIVKRTPVEEEVIAAFEADNAFESIFLNSNNVIEVQQGNNISNDAFIDKLAKNVTEYNEYNPIEKVYLETDKDIFTPDEDLFYSIFTTLGPNHFLSKASKLLYVELINPEGEIILTQKKELMEGRGSGSIKLSNIIDEGTYRLRAYTEWMRNFDSDFFFNKNIEIITDLGANKTVSTNQRTNNIDLQFFPEGGELVLGLNSIVALKAIGNDGLARNVQGNIVNNKGDTLTTLKTVHKGLGLFNILPEIGEKYTAILNNGKEYNLPVVKSSGYNMSINNLDTRTIKVRIQGTSDLKNKTLYVVGHIRNTKYYQGKFKLEGNEELSFEIAKTKFPSGVMTLTLFDEAMQPWSERAIFINNQNGLIITTKTNKNKFRKRDKISLDINVVDSYGDPISTDLSLAVTDKLKAEKSISTSNIMTNLLLESELKGHIENPQVYFKDENLSTLVKRDLLMLTQGWRRIKWEGIEKENYKSPKEYAFPKGISISGIAKERKKKFLSNKPLTIFSKGKDSESIYYTETDENGRFKIEEITQSDSLNLEFVAYSDKGKPIDVIVELNERKNNAPMINNVSNKSYANSNALKKREDYLEVSNLKRKTDSLFSLDGYNVLDEVYLKGPGKKEQEEKTAFLRSRPSEYGIVPDEVRYLDENIPSIGILDILRTIPGVTVAVDQTGRPLIKVRGGTLSVTGTASRGPLWVLDGTVVDLDVIINLSISFARNIERIEVLKNPRSASYGTRGAGGVILLYSRRGGNPISANTAVTSKHKIEGYSVTKEFYSPKYDVKLPKHKRPDYRTTLYWNPRIRTDKNGNARVTFFNSDITEQIQVDIQGISEYGIPGAYLETFGKDK